MASEVFGDKAAKMLGLDGESQGRPTVGRATINSTGKTGAGKVTVQRTGFLFKKGFYKKGLRNKFQKRFFVLKDSFLLWYKKQPPGACNYGMYPEGCVPVGGCTVEQEGKDENGFYFQIVHPEFNEPLLLRSDNLEDTQEWISVLSDCKEATWENALFGDSQILLAKAEGTSEEKKMQEVMAEAKRQAEAAYQAQIEKQEMMERQMQDRQEYLIMLKEKEKETEKLMKQIEEEAIIKDNLKERNIQEEAERKLLERKLEEAKDAVKMLEQTVKGRPGGKSAKDSLLRDIAELTKFLESDSARPSYNGI